MNRFFEVLKNNKNDIIKPVITLLCICIVIPLALALANSVTKDKISALEKENQSKSMQSLIKADSFKEDKIDGFTYYTAESDGKTEGYIFITDEKGYGGTVSVMTAVNTDGTVKSVAILDVSNETPGLGQNAAKESFYSQYSGKKSGVSLLKNGAVSENNEVNAVTGATITSTAVNKAVNKALENYNKVKGEER